MYKIEREELSEKVYNRIKEMILNNALNSGEKLNQEKLAERLGVSRTPLLSAFSKLEKEMLIQLVPRKGAYVSQLSNDEIIDFYLIREKLEPLGAALAAKRAEKEQINNLEKALVNYQKLVEANDISKIKIADYYFHIEIVKTSQMEILHRIISSFNIIIVSNIKGIINDPEVSLKDHVNIVEAIKNKDQESAEKIMFQHLNRSKKILLAKS
ncbi:MAG: GntR family transcriptional regulator [Spirochaetes bacterium]|nr:GntR family transcriptional regulator [Spirochaetota bacterium]